MFPKNFLWGSATASYQVEGGYDQDGRGMTIWDEFTHVPGNSFNNSNGDISSDHYNRVSEDISLMKEMGHTSYRFSIAWSRILPNGKKHLINKEGIEFYSKLIDELLLNGIEPMVTLYHWDLPLALGNIGSWENEETVVAFQDFAEICFKEFGDRVKYWTTFNEPTFFIKSGYIIGNYPPQVKDSFRAMKVFHNVMIASAKAINLYKSLNLDGFIGIVHAYETIYPYSDSPKDIAAATIADDLYNNIVYDVAVNGEYPKGLLELIPEHFDISFIDKDKDILKSAKVDYLGVNYYSRYIIKHYDGDETCLKVNNTGSAEDKHRICIAGLFQVVDSDSKDLTEWDMEIYPQGLTDGLERLHNKYNLPMYITENGIGLRDELDALGQIQDIKRVNYIREHVKAIYYAIEKGIDVRGYYPWSTLDLYSWVNGYDKRYGLIYVDFDNGCTRTPKQSFYEYKEIALSHGKSLF